MPDPRTTRRALSPTEVERADAADNKLSGPVWARAVHHFYDPGFDVRSDKAFQGAINDFVRLDPAERNFHETHLLYRLVLSVESLYGVLRRIEQKLDGVGRPNLTALEHLAPIRAALEEIAGGQSDLVAVDSIDGDEEEEEEDQDELGDEEEDERASEQDPDFVYDTIPDDEPARPRRGRRQPRTAAPTKPEAPASARGEPPRPQRAADPERDALVGDLVPASEGPQSAGAGDR